MSARSFAWLFEAESIQSYIHDSGRLRDAVGASQIVDLLCGSLASPADGKDLLSRVLAAAKVKLAEVQFSRRGGGAFIAFFGDQGQRERVRDLWSLTIGEFAPGLAWLDAIADGDDPLAAAVKGMDALKQARLFRAADPLEAGPWVARSARTGGLLVPASHGQALHDAATLAKRSEGVGGGSVSMHFQAPEQARWPLKLSADEDDEKSDPVFPFLDEQHELAFVHADGNGLGAALHALANASQKHRGRYIELYSGFSRAVTCATQEAAAMAAKASLYAHVSDNAMVPARPLVLGGDDLGMILRPDVAVAFVEAYLHAFEDRTAHHLGRLHDDLGAAVAELPRRLTAACGMVIVGASYPFAQAAAMAEALCGLAKVAIKQEAKQAHRDVPLSALLFLRQTSALPLDDDDPLAATRAKWGEQALVSAAGPYVLAESAQPAPMGLADMRQLRALSAALGASGLARGPLRTILRLMHEDPTQAATAWRNAMRAASRRDPLAQALQAFLAALKPFGIDADADLPFSPANALGERISPLADAMLLADLESSR